jgi:hypothetical protein
MRERLLLDYTGNADVERRYTVRKKDRIKRRRQGKKRVWQLLALTYS